MGHYTVKYEPPGGSSYIPLPKFLVVKKATINLKNEGDVCFKWATTPALNQVENHLERIDSEFRETFKGPQLEGTEISGQIK